MRSKPIMLIVDDIELNREMIKELFFAEFEIITASNGREAIETIQKHEKISIILLDIVMPLIDGIDVLKWISNSDYKFVPVIAITADESYQLKALENGAWDFIPKPVSNSVIRARVYNVLGRFNLEKEKMLTQTLKFYDNLVNESSSAIYVNDVENYELLHLNDTGQKMIGKENEPYKGRKCYEYLFGLTKPCSFCKINKLSHQRFIERDFKYPGDNKIYCLRGKLTMWNDIPAHVEYIQDVSENRKIMDENTRLKRDAEDTLGKYQTIVNTVPGAIVQYEIVNGEAVTKYYSDGLCKLSGYTREERDHFCEKDAMSLIFRGDLPYVRNALKEAVKEKSNLDLTYRLKTKSGVPRYVNLRATYVLGQNGNPEFHAVFSDVDEFKRMEQQLKEQQQRYELTVKSSGINIWEYDIVHDVLLVVSNSPRIMQNCFKIKNYIKSTIENGYVREDCIEEFYDILKGLTGGKKRLLRTFGIKQMTRQDFGVKE